MNSEHLLPLLATVVKREKPRTKTADSVGLEVAEAKTEGSGAEKDTKWTQRNRWQHSDS